MYINLGVFIKYKAKDFCEWKASHRTLYNSFSDSTRVELDHLSADHTLNFLWNLMWKLVSRSYFSKKLGSTSKNMPQEEVSIIFSSKVLVHSNMLPWNLTLKYPTSVRASWYRQKGMERMEENFSVFRPDGWWPRRRNSIHYWNLTWEVLVLERK